MSEEHKPLKSWATRRVVAILAMDNIKVSDLDYDLLRHKGEGLIIYEQGRAKLVTRGRTMAAREEREHTKLGIQLVDPVDHIPKWKGQPMGEFFRTAATPRALEKLGESERIQDRQNRAIDDQNSRVADLEEQLRRARVQDNYLPAPSGREVDLEGRVQKLEGIELLLSRPMTEIAQRIPAFKGTYLKEREIFAQYILTQKAFAEIVMQYGQTLGKTPDQVTSEVEQVQELVRDGHNKFGNNLDAEIKGVLGYAQRTQDKKNEVQQKADEENLRDFERVLENWGSAEKQRELPAEDKGKIEKIQNKISGFKKKLGLS